jgi:hypothetical protein
MSLTTICVALLAMSLISAITFAAGVALGANLQAKATGNRPPFPFRPHPTVVDPDDEPTPEEPTNRFRL